jgi:bla regulator protein blaR1
MTAWLNGCSAVWFNWMAAMLWQSAILIAIVWAADSLLRRFAWPQLRYVLWLLIFVKLLLPPGFALPTGVTSSGIAVLNQFFRQNSTEQARLSSNRQIVQLPVENSRMNARTSSGRAIAPSLAWQAELMLIWLAGVVALALWLCLKLLRLRMERSPSGFPEWFPSVFQECANRLSIKRKPALAVTSVLKCPAVFGVFRPTILIPSESIVLIEKKNVSNILLHELTHIKRWDPSIHAVQIALQILYWPNLLLWLVRRRLQNLRELCCDADVASVLRENTPSYRQTLLDMARRLIAEPANPGLGLLGLFEQPHTIVTRLKYLEKPLGRQTLCKYISAFMAFLMIVFILPMSPMQAETANQEKPAPEIAKSNTPSKEQEKPKFEAISIKRSPKGNLSDFDSLPGGRLKVINLPIRILIARGYGIPLLQVEGVPGFLKDIDWDIEATPEEGKYPLKNGLLNPELGRLMVQSMLEDRFSLKLHQETKILPGYELIVAKGGSKLAPPEDLKFPPAPGGGFLRRTKDPQRKGPGLIMPGYRFVPNTSLKDFAISLSLTLSYEGEVKRFHVVDKTGLEGFYDIELKWTPNREGASVASQNKAAADPEITIFDAIQEQLGLKLMPAKVTVPVLVVDDAQMPNTN